MAIDLSDPDRRCEPGDAGWRAPPQRYTRPAMPEAIGVSRGEADGKHPSVRLWRHADRHLVHRGISDFPERLELLTTHAARKMAP